MNKKIYITADMAGKLSEDFISSRCIVTDTSEISKELKKNFPSLGKKAISTIVEIAENTMIFSPRSASSEEGRALLALKSEIITQGVPGYEKPDYVNFSSLTEEEKKERSAELRSLNERNRIRKVSAMAENLAEAVSSGVLSVERLRSLLDISSIWRKTNTSRLEREVKNHEAIASWFGGSVSAAA